MSPWIMLFTVLVFAISGPEKDKILETLNERLTQPEVEEVMKDPNFDKLRLRPFRAAIALCDYLGSKSKTNKLIKTQLGDFTGKVKFQALLGTNIPELLKKPGSKEYNALMNAVADRVGNVFPLKPLVEQVVIQHIRDIQEYNPFNEMRDRCLRARKSLIEDALQRALRSEPKRGP